MINVDTKFEQAPDELRASISRRIKDARLVEHVGVVQLATSAH